MAENLAVAVGGAVMLVPALLRRGEPCRAGPIRGPASGSDSADEFGERGRDATARRAIDTEFGVATTNILHQRVTAHDHQRRMVTFEAAHRSQPCVESAVIALDTIVRMLLRVHCRRDASARGGVDFTLGSARRPPGC